MTHPLEDDIQRTYVKLMNARIAFFETSRSAETCKNHLETTVATAIASGEIQGKNETERKAKALDLYTSQYKELEELEDIAAHKKLDLDIAQLMVDMIRALLRIEEIKARSFSNDHD